MALTDKLTAIANAVRSKTGETSTMTLDQMPNRILNIEPISNEEWHQCPTLVKNYLDNVIYDPTDYSYSDIEDYAPGVADQSNTKPIGKLVEGTTFYNAIPNGNTSFSTQNVAGVLNPLDSLRWLNTYTLNVRDLGGWNCDGGTVKYGMLVRGGEPIAFDKSLMVDEVGIKHELQLRGWNEVNNDLNGRFYSLWDIEYTCPQFYNWMSLSNTDVWKEVIRCVFDCSIKYSQPLYFHCAAGADRTGTVAVMLEALLGMSQSDIDKDYELTCFSTGVSTASNARRRDEDEYKNYIAAIKSVPLVGGLTDTFRNHAVSFILSLGFTIDEINAFRALMIIGNPDIIEYTPTSYSITKTLTNVTSTSTVVSVDKYQSLTIDLKANSGYAISDYSITMGGVSIPGTFSGTKVNLYRSITYVLTNCTTNNGRSTVIDGQSFGAVITPNVGYTLDGATVSITMGGTSVAEYYSNGIITIPNVTGNVVISVTAVESAPVNILDEIGYHNGYRLSGSTGEESASVGACTTGFIPVELGDIIRLKGFTFDGYPNSTVCLYDASQAMLHAQSDVIAPMTGGYSFTVDSNNIFEFTYTSDSLLSGVAYIKISATCNDGATAFATKNQNLPS